MSLSNEKFGVKCDWEEESFQERRRQERGHRRRRRRLPPDSPHSAVTSFPTSFFPFESRRGPVVHGSSATVAMNDGQRGPFLLPSVRACVRPTAPKGAATGPSDGLSRRRSPLGRNSSPLRVLPLPREGKAPRRSDSSEPKFRNVFLQSAADPDPRFSGRNRGKDAQSPFPH